MKTSRITGTLGAFVFLLTFVAPASASQPKFISVNTSQVPASGSASSVSGSFDVKNTSAIPISIKVKGMSGENARWTYSIEKSSLAPNESTTVGFRGSFLRNGRLAAYSEIEVTTASGRILDRQLVDLSFEVSGDSFKKLDDDARPEGVPAFATTNVTARIDRWPYADAPNDVRNGPTVDQMDRVPDSSSDLDVVLEGGLADRMEAVAPTSLGAPAKPPTADSNSTLIKGVFKYRGIDGLTHPAAVWEVQIWTWENNAIKQKITGNEVFTGWDGTWSYHVPNTYGGKSVAVLYRAWNRFFEMRNHYQDIPHTLYVPLEGHLLGGTISTSSLVDFSSNTQNPENEGLGDVYNEGVRLWLAFYNAGLEAKTSSPYIAYYPNKKHNCPGAMSLGSCSEAHTPNLYVDRHDIGRGGVMQHELTHKILAHYWSATSTLDDAVGPHSLEGCATNATLALSEGFANFVPFWVQYSRNSTAFGTGLLGIDTIEEPYAQCIQPYRSETLVAGIFWDLYDTTRDAPDDLYWKNKAAVIKIFLTAGGHKSMADFRQVYMDKSGPAYKAMVGSIFDAGSKPK